MGAFRGRLQGAGSISIRARRNHAPNRVTGSHPAAPVQWHLRLGERKFSYELAVRRLNWGSRLS